MSTNPSPLFTGRPFQLTNGEWGVLLTPQQGLRPPQEGDAVQITSKGGKSWPARIYRQVPRDDGQLVFTVHIGEPPLPVAAQPPPPSQQAPQQASAPPPAGILYCPHCFRPIQFLPG